ncbi:phage late control D family protein [Paludibacterium paludis]|uniref:Phage protein D n=1 Tax=Paludibacterium paludis TaxID=1225769 RepID=A0A918NX69_9NEIS|nr:phage late control D family protein [Paludibacterium paludis]GGY03689.1 hypothetical protein GCM10011289_02530 [Paludibacterium paludis]
MNLPNIDGLKGQATGLMDKASSMVDKASTMAQGIKDQAAGMVDGLADGLADKLGVEPVLAPVYKVELLPKILPIPVDNSALQAEFESVKRAWNAELDKQVALLNQRSEWRSKRDAANASGNAPAAAAAEREMKRLGDKADAIQKAAKAKYEPRYDKLKAKLEPPPEPRKDITKKFAGRLISLKITDNRGFESDQLDLSLDDSDGRLDIPERGRRISVSIGWKGRPLIDKGVFVIDEITHEGAPDIMTIRGRATDLRAGISTKREKSWHKTTVGKIVSAIAKANYLTPVISSWLASRPVEHMDQANESDGNLLTRLAQQHDAIATVKQGKLLFIKAGDATSATGKPFPTVIIKRKTGDRHHFSMADRDAYTAVKACWHNLDKATRGEVMVDKDTLFERRSVVTKRGKLSKRKHMTARQGTPDKALSPSASNVKVLRHVYASEATAWQGAKAAWEKLQRGVAEFSYTLAIGRPELFPEIPAKVVGIKPIIDRQPWVISKVTHDLSDSGMTTSLELEMKLEDIE